MDVDSSAADPLSPWPASVRVIIGIAETTGEKLA